jgi:phosphate acetyltransferase
MNMDSEISMYNPKPLAFIENRTYDEIAVGDTAVLTRKLREEDIQLFAIMSGDMNPTHLDHEYAKSGMFREVVGHSMWGGTLISSVLGTEFPGPGTVYIDQSLHFCRPVILGDTITVTITAAQKYDHNKHIVFDCRCVNQHGLDVITGSAEVLAPSDKIKRPKILLPEVHMHDNVGRYQQLLAMTAGLQPITMAVVHPCDPESLKGAVGAAEVGLIIPILFGPEKKIRSVAEQEGLDIRPYRIVDTPHSHAAAEMAVALVREGGADSLMKGSLHTDELMAEVVASRTGLRTARRVSHVFLMDIPNYHKYLLITDAAINISPSLEVKVDILQNAIDLAHALKIAEPKVAILSAVETVTPKLQSTLDAAALCKMADRGQIKGGILDGPLAFDNAISSLAAKAKGIKSVVSGDADIMLVPDLESGNMLAKQLEYLADAHAAGIVLGASVPIVLTSRADPMQARVASCAVALLLAQVARDRAHNGGSV